MTLLHTNLSEIPKRIESSMRDLSLEYGLGIQLSREENLI